MFNLSKQYYQLCKRLKLPHFLKSQILRASSSIALNIAEGSGKRTPKDQIRFYSNALGSLRECQATLELEDIQHAEIKELGNQIGAILFKLCRFPKSNRTPDPQTSNSKPSN